MKWLCLEFANDAIVVFVILVKVTNNVNSELCVAQSSIREVLLHLPDVLGH